MKGIAVRVRNFKEYLGRADVKHHLWFRCSNRILEDEDFFDFSDAEILVWIYILSLCSQKKSDTVYINFDRAERFARRKQKDILSAIEKLQGKQLDRVTEHDPDGSRTDHVQNPCATGQDKQDSNPPEHVPDGELHQLAVVWNESSGDLPKVREWNKDRDRLVKKLPKDFGEKEMHELVVRVLESDFLTGKVKKWRASFDWVLKKRIAILEGNYDNSGAQAMRVVL